MFGRRTLFKDYAGIISQIREGERRAPRHKQPESIRGAGWDRFVTPAHEVVYEDFRWFGAMLNHQASEPWSIEELPDVLVRSVNHIDEPDVGRRYSVHYNACDMGTLQVTVGGIRHLLDPEAFASEPCALVLVELSYLRFVPFEDVLSLLAAIGKLLGRFEDAEAAYKAAVADATPALTAYLWEAMRMEESVPDFYHRVEGPYERVRLTTTHWQTSGIDPFLKWNGDRPRYERKH